ncbi:hypothetical protein COB57_02740 [Candidatus Peregrinibacteria bacterium]|nr:MAG: hypothetical protein COB57_02740 [Candidatus Peregrinibacteria bacterium]
MNNILTEKLLKFTKDPKNQKSFSRHKKMLILAEKIYGRRKDLNLSQSDLAKKAGTTQRIISELEHSFYAVKQGLTEEMYDKLAEALEIDRDYLFSDKIDRKTFELFAYLESKVKKKLDVMQLMKLPYFIDLHFIKELGFQISNFTYIRYTFGPFDKKVYAYESLFTDTITKIHYSYIKDFFSIIDSALEELPINNGDKLKKESYNTYPMKNIGATLGGKEGWGELLIL